LSNVQQLEGQSRRKFCTRSTNTELTICKIRVKQPSFLEFVQQLAS